MTIVIEQANLLARLVLELLSLVLVGLAAGRAVTTRSRRLATIAVAVIAVVLVWVAVVHGPLPAPVRVGAQVAVFGAAAWSLGRRRGRAAAMTFGAAVSANAALMEVWNQ